MIQQGPETGLYGENKGLAQVIDLNTDQWRRNEQQSALAGQKKTAKGESDIEKGVGAAETGAKSIFARDRDHFNDMQQDLKKFVVDNHQKIASHDPKTYMEFQDKVGKITQEAELSHNLREQIEQVDKDKSLEGMRPEAKDYYNSLKFDKPDYSDWGKAYQLDQSKMKKDFDMISYIKNEVKPFAEKSTQGTEYTSPTGEKSSSKAKEFTKEEAGELLAKTAGAHPQAHEQALHDINKLPESEKQKYRVSTPEGDSYDVNAYMKDKYSSLLTAGNEKETKYEAGKKDKSYTYNSGSGTWESDKFRWALEEKDNAGVPSRTVNVLGVPVELPALKGNKTKEINFASTAEGENKPIVVNQADGSKKQVIPLSFRTDNDGKDWQFVGVAVDDKGKPVVDAQGNSEPVTIPAQDVKGKIKAEYGFDLDKAAKEAKLGVTEGTGGSTTRKTSGVSSSSVKGKTLSVKKLNDAKKTKLTIDQVKKMFPDANVIE